MSGPGQSSPRTRAVDPLPIPWIAPVAMLVWPPLLQVARRGLEQADTGAFTLMDDAAARSGPGYLIAIRVPLAARPISRTGMPANGLARILVRGTAAALHCFGATGSMPPASPDSGRADKVRSGASSDLFDGYATSGLTFSIAIYSFRFIFIFTAATAAVAPDRDFMPRRQRQ